MTYDEFERQQAISLKKYNRNRRARRRRRVRQWVLTIFLLILISGLFLLDHFFARHRNISSQEVLNPNTVTTQKNLATTDSPSAHDPTSSLDPTSWNLILVNLDHPVPEDFPVELYPLNNGHAVDSRIYPDLQAMMDAARAEGLSPFICSSYRTQEKQTALYEAQVRQNLASGYSRKEAEEQAAIWVAPPGTSEHQTGLALDIVSSSYQQLDEAQEDTPEQKWLMEHCAEYGFILRYPTTKSEITGIGYEPWHYRYVGKEAAKEIMEKGICLEEYLEGK